MMKLLIGGSPCTHWSIAQTKNRETKPEGIGWELFENFLIALAKFKPDYFLYENNKSMSPAIRAEITKRFGFKPVCINSAKVSAQNRQRLYWCGKRNPDGTYHRVDVEQPEDRGILLRDILETGVAFNEKGYTLKAQYCKSSAVNAVDGGHFPAPMAAEPVRIGTIENSAKNQDFDSQPYRVYAPDGKSVTLCGQGCGVGAKTGLYAAPVRVGDMPNAKGEISGSQSGRIYSMDGKGVPLQARPNGGGADGAATGLYAIPVNDPVWFNVNDLQPPPNDRVLAYAPSRYDYGDFDVCIMRGYQCVPNATHGVTHWSPLPEKPSQDPCAGRMVGRRINEEGHRDDYNESVKRFQRFEINENPQKTNCLSTVTKDNLVIQVADGKTYPVYEVRNGLITIKGKQYPIKLADGFYIIRKLTVTECKRLQTVPDSYVFPVADTQAYKMLGNGWTVDVIAHILSHCPGITAEPLDVLSMYDGMACGHIALDKLGARIARYRATEIDKYAIKTACYNFPDIEQLGDAFQVREW